MFRVPNIPKDAVSGILERYQFPRSLTSKEQEAAKEFQDAIQDATEYALDTIPNSRYRSLVLGNLETAWDNFVKAIKELGL